VMRAFSNYYDVILCTQPQSTAVRLVLISHSVEDRRLSWSDWLVTFPLTLTHFSTSQVQCRVTLLM